MSTSGLGAVLGLFLGTGLLLIWRSRRVPSTAAVRSSGFTRNRNEQLRRAGLQGASSTQLLLVQIAAGLLSMIVVLLATSTVTISLSFGIFGALVPWVLVRRLARTRLGDLRAVWPEVVDNLVSAVRAGLSLPEALSGLAVRGPEVLRGPFAEFGARYRSSGRFMACLDALKDELADPVADRIIETLRVAREVGGTDLGRVLRTLATFLREDARVRAELETRQGWTVNAARLAVASPWAVLLLLATQQTTLVAYDTPVGTGLLIGGAVVCLVAYRLMLRIGRLPDEPRVLS